MFGSKISTNCVSKSQNMKEKSTFVNIVYSISIVKKDYRNI